MVKSRKLKEKSLLHRAIEIILVIILTVILSFFITPIINNVFYDLLPTNISYSLEELLDKSLANDCEYKYIQRGNYLNALIYDSKESLIYNFYAYKGKSSGFIEIKFGFFNRNFSKVRYKTIDFNDARINLILVKHNDKYLIDISSFETDLVFIDSDGFILDSIIQKSVITSFEVYDSIQKDFSVTTNIKGENYKIIDYQQITNLLD